MTDDFISRLEALGREATEGPWLIEDDSPEAWRVYIERNIRYVAACDDMDGGGTPEIWEGDARFIATARNCWDELVAVVRAAERYVDIDAPYGIDDAVAALRQKVSES